MGAEARTDSAADQDLVERASCGDEAAARAIYLAHAPRVARRLRRLLGASSEVEDAVQLTFEALFRSLHRFERGRALGPWLDGFVVRVAQNSLRARRRKRWLSFGTAYEAPPAAGVATDIDERLTRQQLVREVYQSMARLTPKQRVAYVLHEVEGLSLTEIGRLAGASPQAIYERLVGARAVIMRALEERGLLPAEDGGGGP
jgi:RNA polymerase sigma-70 factor (ECF subfamily)